MSGAAPPTAERTFKPTFVYEPVFGTRMYGEDLHALTRLEPSRSLVAIALNWAILVGTIAATVALGRWWLYPLAILVVGARQHALLILMHDAAHMRILPDRRWNERVSDWFCAFPHGVSTDAYRRDHLAHHFYMNTERDPNWTSKIGLDDWVFPKSRREVAWIFLKEVCGFGMIRIVTFILHYGENTKRAAEKPRNSKRALLLERVAYYGLAAAAFTYFALWPAVLLLWVLPLLTVLPALLRLRVLAEHYGLERVHDLNHSRNYHCNALERFFLAPHNVWLHIDHHLFPSIPWYNLPRAHEVLLRIPDYAAKAHETEGVLAPKRHTVLVELTTQ